MRLGLINSKMTYMAVEEQKQAILDYAKKNNRKIDNILIDDELAFDLFRDTTKKVTLVLPNVAVLGNRYEDILKSVQAYSSLDVSLYFIAEDILVSSEIPNSFSIVSEICFKLYKSILSLKNKGIVANIRKSGRKVGRPFNSKNNTTLLEDKADEIFALKAQGLTNFQIAERLGCATTTLYNFYKRQKELNNA